MISSCKRLSYLSKWLPNWQIMKMQQPTNKSTLRIQHTCIKKRHFHISRALSLHRKQDEPCQEPSSRDMNYHQSTKGLQANQKLRSWSFNVNSFGKIVIQKTPFDVLVKPVSPLEYPAADKAFITLKIKTDREVDEELFETIANSLQADVEYKNDKLLVDGHFSNLQAAEVETKLKNQEVSVQWHAEVPISFGNYDSLYSAFYSLLKVEPSLSQFALKGHWTSII